jgi:hypothetical protein
VAVSVPAAMAEFANSSPAAAIKVDFKICLFISTLSIVFALFMDHFNKAISTLTA